MGSIDIRGGMATFQGILHLEYEVSIPLITKPDAQAPYFICQHPEIIVAEIPIAGKRISLPRPNFTGPARGINMARQVLQRLEIIVVHIPRIILGRIIVLRMHVSSSAF